MNDITDQIAAWADSVDLHEDRAITAEVAMNPTAPHVPNRSNHRRMVIAGIGAGLLLVAGTIAFVTRSPESTDHLHTGTGTTNPPTSTTSPERRCPTPPPPDPTPAELDAPPGMTPVVDQCGGFAGYLGKLDDNLGPNADGSVPLGSRHPVKGAPVTDRDGSLTGYMIAGLGFVSAADAADPATIDRLYDAHLALQARAEAQLEDEATTTANEIRQELTDDGIDCRGTASRSGDEVKPASIPSMVVGLDCTVDDVVISLRVYQSESMKRLTIEGLRLPACEIAPEERQFVNGPTWTIQAQAVGASTSDTALTKRIASAVDAPIQSLPCG